MPLFTRTASSGVVCELPRIEVHDDFATAEECQHIIDLARDDMGSASIVNAEGESVENQLRRTANIGWVFTDQTATVKGLVARVSELAGLPARHCERIQVVHYEAGGKYTPHLDTYKADPSNAHWKRSGQRLKTGLLYLHEPGKGGATSFPKVKTKVKAQVGRLALFDLVEPGTVEPDLRSVHAGTPVWSGEKWACNFWFCERPVASASRKSAPKHQRGGTKKKRKKRK